VACDRLPTEQRKRENKTEIGPSLTAEKHKKGFDRSVNRSVELRFGVCFQENVLWGVGSWAGYIGRGLQVR
jgi:hypothetical protein